MIIFVFRQLTSSTEENLPTFIMIVIIIIIMTIVIKNL